MLGLVSRASQRATVVFRHIRSMSGLSTVGSPEGPADEVLLETKGSKGIITLNRPKALNALNLNMIQRIYPQLKAWEEDPNMTMVMIKGAGEKSFCAGGDIRAVTDAGKVGDPLSEKFFKEEYILNNAIGTLNIPWIAFIDGITMGGGVGLSVHGQFRIATERTVFAMPETAIGLFPDVGGGYFLPRLGGSLGLYLSLTGFRLKGRDVQKAGVATHFIESKQVPELENALLSLDSATEQDVAKTLQQFHDSCDLDRSKEFSLTPHLEDINRLFSASSVEGVIANLAMDGSEWSMKQVETLKKMSPTSMKLTLRQLKEGATMTLQEVLAMEYRLTQHIMQDKDFYEGVRAVLVDKDHKPQWNPATLEGITNDKVDWFFSRLSEDKELKLQAVSEPLVL